MADVDKQENHGTDAEIVTARQRKIQQAVGDQEPALTRAVIC